MTPTAEREAVRCIGQPRSGIVVRSVALALVTGATPIPFSGDTAPAG